MANTGRITQDAVEFAVSQNGNARITQNIIEFITSAGVTCNSPPNGTFNVAYSHTLGFGGGTPPYTFVVTVGILPPGLVLNASTAVISGIPTAPGVYPFTVQVTDAMGTTGTATCSITIVGSPPPKLNTITGGLPSAIQGCKPRNVWDWCMFLEAMRHRKIKFPPLCSIPEEFRACWPLPWADDFGSDAVPEQAVPFRNAGGIVTPTTASGDNIVIAERVPTGYDGLILGAYWFYTGSGFLEGSGDIVWRVQLNLRFLENLGNVPFQMGSVQSPLPMTEGQIVLSGQVMRVLVNVPNLSGLIQIGASRINAGLLGFYWPR